METDAKQSALMWLAGFLIVVVAIFFLYICANNDHSSDFAIFLIGGTLFFIGLVAVISLAFSMANIGDSKAPLALPEGSIRGILAVGLLAVFIGTSAFLFTGLANPGPAKAMGDKNFASEAAAKEYVDKTASSDLFFITTPDPDRRAPNAAAGAPVPQIVSAFMRSNPQAAQDMAKLVFVAASTALATITGFYFGSGTASTANKQAVAAEQARSAGGDAMGAGNQSSAQKLLLAAMEDANAVAKACHDAAVADQNAGSSGRPANDKDYDDDLTVLPQLKKQADDLLAQMKAKAADIDKKLADARAETDTGKKKTLADSTQPLLADLQQSADALRALRTKAEAKNVYVQKVLPPPAQQAGAQDLPKAAAVIAQRLADTQRKFDALGKDALTTLQQTVTEAGDAVSDPVKDAAKAAADAWAAMQASLQALGVDANRAQAAAATAGQDAAKAKAVASVIAAVNGQSQQSAQDFDAAAEKFAKARSVVHEQAAQG